MKYQSPFSKINKKYISNCLLLKFLPSALSVNCSNRTLVNTFLTWYPDITVRSERMLVEIHPYGTKKTGTIHRNHGISLSLHCALKESYMLSVNNNGSDKTAPIRKLASAIVVWIKKRMVFYQCTSFEPQCQKTYLRPCAPNEDSSQTAYLLFVWKIFAFLAIENMPSEDSDQTSRMRGLIWIFAGRHIRRYVFERWGSLLCLRGDENRTVSNYFKSDNLKGFA